MRTISITTEVFSMIWANRIDGEESENTILLRLLKSRNTLAAIDATPIKFERTKDVPSHLRDASWWKVIKHVLERKPNHEASLGEIYKGVKDICEAVGRKAPGDATIRGTLENNSSDSDKHTGVRNVFCMPKGKGAGVWGLRKKV